MGNKNVKRKKVKYRSIFFKVTDKQKQVIDDYCNKNGLGTVQLFKLALREFIERNAVYEQGSIESLSSENQMTIFDVIRELEIDDDY